MSETQIIVEPGQQDVVIKHVFDAPRDVVFRAITDPELIPTWWGPRELETRVDQMNPQAGGSWRFIHRDADGNEYGFRGVYHDVTPNQVVQTFEFEGAPGHVALETLTLEKADGKTTLVAQQLHPSREARDAAVATGMEEGTRQTYQRLEDVVQKLK